jgi:hypothetical protein
MTNLMHVEVERLMAYCILRHVSVPDSGWWWFRTCYCSTRVCTKISWVQKPWGLGAGRRTVVVLSPSRLRRVMPCARQGLACAHTLPTQETGEH